MLFRYCPKFEAPSRAISVQGLHSDLAAVRPSTPHRNMGSRQQEAVLVLLTADASAQGESAARRCARLWFTTR